MVDCYNEYEQPSAFEVYLTDALRAPFVAAWGQGVSATAVTVLGVVVPAIYQLWAAETPGVNATLLDDYRAFVQQGGLPFDEHEEWDE